MRARETVELPGDIFIPLLNFSNEARRMREKVCTFLLIARRGSEAG